MLKDVEDTAFTAITVVEILVINLLVHSDMNYFSSDGHLA